MNEFEHGGNIHKEAKIAGPDSALLDFSANINPLGPPEWLRPVISSQLSQITHYPDPENSAFLDAVAKYTGIDRDLIVIGNGTTEILYTLMRVVPCHRVVIPVPSYVDYVRSAELAGKTVHTVELKECDNFMLDPEELKKSLLPTDLVVLASPNNPTGCCIQNEVILALADGFPETTFLIDEAFLDFIDKAKSVGGMKQNVYTLNSMTKFYGVPGLRIGYGTFSKETAQLLGNHMIPWSVNSFGHVFAAKAFEDEQYQNDSRAHCEKLRNDLTTALAQISCLKIYPSSANYLFIKLLQGDSTSLYDHCRKQSILIRRCDNYRGLEDSSYFVRVAVRTAKENKRLIAAFQSYYAKEDATRSNRKPKKAARSLMFQGTCSDAGKSILTAGLCRVLIQDGIHVAPFKAQNMSLNSFVTLQGDEMGRAQVVQAQAAKLDPESRMNPVLLKPNSDTGSQIIVCGKPVGNMSVSEYNLYKPEAWKSVCRCYDSLKDEFDVVVLEGAGSPGEVNLKHDDIVNMRMARYAESPVILIGDIDRGGVYASFVGILEVLAQWERDLVAGFLVNKFRGQASLLDSAHDYVQLHTGRKVFGVLPFLSNLGLPEEDSVSFKKGSFNTQNNREESIKIALINLPHISNFTDVEPFLEEPDVSLHVIDRIDQLDNPQAIILPGSKNVIHDLKFLRSSGLIDAIIKYQEKGVETVGICGGYQMLGTSIADPYEIESNLEQVEGMGLLQMQTIIEKEKTLRRKSGIHKRSGESVFGYEIHHGISSAGDSSVLQFDDTTYCGTESGDGLVWGSYLHGIFDSDGFRRWFIDRLRVKKGMHPLEKIVAPYDLETAFDRLADSIRENVDMNEIYRLLRL